MKKLIFILFIQSFFAFPIFADPAVICIPDAFIKKPCQEFSSKQALKQSIADFELAVDYRSMVGLFEVLDHQFGNRDQAERYVRRYVPAPFVTAYYDKHIDRIKLGKMYQSQPHGLAVTLLGKRNSRPRVMQPWLAQSEKQVDKLLRFLVKKGMLPNLFTLTNKKVPLHAITGFSQAGYNLLAALPQSYRDKFYLSFTLPSNMMSQELLTKINYTKFSNLLFLNVHAGASLPKRGIPAQIILSSSKQFDKSYLTSMSLTEPALQTSALSHLLVDKSAENTPFLSKVFGYKAYANWQDLKNQIAILEHLPNLKFFILDTQFLQYMHGNLESQVAMLDSLSQMRDLKQYLMSRIKHNKSFQVYIPYLPLSYYQHFGQAIDKQVMVSRLAVDTLTMPIWGQMKRLMRSHVSGAITKTPEVKNYMMHQFLISRVGVSAKQFTEILSAILRRSLPVVFDVKNMPMTSLQTQSKTALKYLNVASSRGTLLLENISKIDTRSQLAWLLKHPVKVYGALSIQLGEHSVLKPKQLASFLKSNQSRYEVKINISEHYFNQHNAGLRQYLPIHQAVLKNSEKLQLIGNSLQSLREEIVKLG